MGIKKIIKIKNMISNRVKKITTDNLAVMIKRGFDQTDKRFDRIEGRLDCLEKGQEEIKLKLDNVAYRFELVAL